MDIETIVESWVNGQKKQAKEQCRKYGIKKFIIALIEDPEWYISSENQDKIIVYMLSS